MGNISKNNGWQHPITRQNKKALHLERGVLQSVSELNHDLGYSLASYVDDQAWLSSLKPQIPESRPIGKYVIRATHATLRIESQNYQLLVDPGLDVSLEGANPDVIVVTHAHADHAGGLLDAAERFSDAALICSSGTFELLQLLPGADEYERVFRDRGHIVKCDGQPIKAKGIEFRLFSAGHLYGAALLDVANEMGRLLITGDFSLRETGGLPGGVWPTADYDLLIMESSHAWDVEAPTADEVTNWQSLIDACQSAVNDGYSRIAIPAMSLGEAQEIYYALCQAQMGGVFGDFTLRMVGKAADVARLYQRESHSAFDPWKNALHTLNSLDYIPDHSIVIGSNIEPRDADGERNQDAIAYVVPTIGSQRRSSGYSFNISTHASYRELFATALAIKCYQVALYHGTNSSESRSPLTQLIELTGRKVTTLTDTPQLLGGKL